MHCRVNQECLEVMYMFRKAENRLEGKETALLGVTRFSTLELRWIFLRRTDIQIVNLASVLKLSYA